MRVWLAGVVVLAVLAPAIPAQAAPHQRVIMLRPGYAELFVERNRQRVVPLPWGPVRMDALVRSIGDPSWAALSRDGVLTLKADLSQRPGTEMHVRSPVRAVRGNLLSGTRSTVVFDNVTVAGYVRYLNRSTVVAKRTTFDGRGVTLGSGGRIAATDTVFRGGNRGLDVYRAARVSLTRVSATRNADAGIVIHQAGTVLLSDVTATENAGSGIVLRGPLPARSFTGTVRSAGNRTGVELSGLGAVPVGPLRTERNAKAGVVFDRCPGCVVAGLSAADETVGVLVQSLSPSAVLQDSTLERSTTAGVRTAAGTRLTNVTVAPAATAVGVRVPRGVPDVRVESSAVHGGAVAVSTDGSRTTVSEVTVTGSRVGVRIGGNADQTTVSRVSTVDTETGLVANSGSTAVTVSQLRVAQHGGRGVKSAADRLEVAGSEITGADIGLDLKGRAAVSTSSVTDAAEGIRAGAPAELTLTGTTVRARVLGLRTSDAAHVVLADSDVEAPRGAKGPVELRGDTHFPAMPFRWIGIFGLATLALAVGLEMVRRRRERRHNQASTAPEHVTNIT